ncbi:MAG: NADH-quinone oxidoreductase subunit M [Myxococcota bacterium]
MDYIVSHLLTILVFMPALGALVLFMFPEREKGAAKSAALVVTLTEFALSLALIPLFEVKAGYQLVQKVEWIPSIGASYHVGVDGISVFLVLLTTLLTPISIMGTLSSVQNRVREYLILILLLETAMLGALVALDVLLFYFFWEAMLIPMYFLIGIWGYDLRVLASVKFFIYTMVGSLLMLVAILYVWHVTDFQGVPGGKSFDLPLWVSQVPRNPHIRSWELWLFGAFALAFAIKVPMVPFHTWLPLAHVQAPTAGSVILAGVLLKMGTYGFIRFAMPLFPHATLSFVPGLALLGVIGVVYGALVAMVQKDIKKLVAYSSVSHLGFCMLGLAALEEKAVVGSVYQGLNHGISTGALFLLVGALYERRHTREIAEYGGIAARIPEYTVVFMIITFSSIGLPGLNGFVGEFLILIGTFSSNVFKSTYMGPNAGVWMVFVAATGVIFAAVYLLWMVKRVFFGPLRNPANQEIEDLNMRERLTFAPLVIMAVVMGVFPTWFMDRITPAVQQTLAQVRRDASIPVQTAVLDIPGVTRTAPTAMPVLEGAAGAPRGAAPTPRLELPRRPGEGGPMPPGLRRLEMPPQIPRQNP